MNEIYLHTCIFKLPSTEPIWDEENGGWTDGQQGEEVELRCRAVPNGSGKQALNKDGVSIVYAFDLAFPAGTPNIPADTLITITGLDNVKLFEGRILRFQKGIYHSIGWV